MGIETGGWVSVGDRPITIPDNTLVFVRGRYGDVYGPIPAGMTHPDACAGDMLHASQDIVAIKLATPAGDKLDVC